VKGRGKSGGIRNIYYHHEEESLILMIFVYEKSKTEDLKNFYGGLNDG